MEQQAPTDLVTARMQHAVKKYAEIVSLTAELAAVRDEER